MEKEGDFYIDAHQAIFITTVARRAHFIPISHFVKQTCIVCVYLLELIAASQSITSAGWPTTIISSAPRVNDYMPLSPAYILLLLFLFVLFMRSYQSCDDGD